MKHPYDKAGVFLLFITMIFGFIFAISFYGCGTQEGASTSTTTSTSTTSTVNRLSWTFVTEQIYWASPTIDDDGTIYVGSGRLINASDINALYALNPDGTLKWKYETGCRESIKGAVSIGPSGTLYGVIFAEDEPNSHLYAFNPDGSLKWKYENLGQTDISNFGEWTPAISSSEVIYAPSTGSLHAINSDGTLKWEVSGARPGENFSSPAIGRDGTIYVNTDDSGILAINPDGTEKWRYSTTGLSYSSPSIGSDETIYVGKGSEITNNQYLYALNFDGTLKWKFYTAGLIVMASPSIDSDGTIYVGTTAKGYAAKAGQCGIFFAINPDGTEKWRYDTTSDMIVMTSEAQADIYSSAAIGADGTIYFSSESRYFYAFNPDGSLKEKYDLFALSPISSGCSTITYSSPAVASDGTIYVGDYYHFCDLTAGTAEGAVYALISSSEGLANTPWPKIHNNNKNAGRKL